MDGELEPDLLLAIQLSLQEVGDAENENEAPEVAADSEAQPDQVTDTEKKEEKEEEEEKQPEPEKSEADILKEEQMAYFTELINCLQKEDLFASAVEIEKSFLPLLPFLECDDKVVFTSLVAFEFFVKVIEVLLLSLYDSSKFYEVFGTKEQKTFFRRLYRSALSFCLRGLETITTARTQEKKQETAENTQEQRDPEKLKELRTSLFHIISNCCVTEKLPSKIFLTNKRKDLSSLVIPQLPAVLSCERVEVFKQEDILQSNGNLLNRLLEVKPSPVPSAKPEPMDISTQSIDRGTLMKFNIFTLHAELDGIIRLFAMCEKLVMEHQLLDESDVSFVFGVVEFLGSRAFATYCPSKQEIQKHASASVSLVISLGKIHTHISQFVSNEIFEHGFQMVQHHGCSSLSFNVQCLIARQILQQQFQKDIFASLLVPKIQCSIEFNFSLVNMAFEIYKNALIDSIVLEPITLTPTNTLVVDGFDCFQNYGVGELTKFLLELPLLDITYATVLASYKNECVAHVFETKEKKPDPPADEKPPTPPPPPPSKAAAKISSSKPKSTTKKKSTKPRTTKKESSSKDKVVMKGCKSNREFFENISKFLVQLTQDESPTVRQYIRESLTENHISALLFIANCQSGHTIHEIENNDGKIVLKRGPILGVPIASKTLNMIAFSFTTNNLLTKENEDFLLETIGYRKDSWSLCIPCEYLTFLLRVLFVRCVEDKAIVKDIWSKVVSNLSVAIKNAYSETIMQDILGPEHMQLLLALFDLLSAESKRDIFSSLAFLLQQECTDKPRNILPLSRLLVIVTYLLFYYDKVSPTIESSLVDFLYGKPAAYTLFSKRLEQEELTIVGDFPTLYFLPTPKELPQICSVPNELLFAKQGDSEHKAEDFFKLLQVSVGATSKNSQIYYEYYFHLYWDFIKVLPQIGSEDSLQIPEQQSNFWVHYLFSLMKRTFDKGLEIKTADVAYQEHLQQCISTLQSLCNTSLSRDSSCLTLAIARAIIQVLEVSFTAVTTLLCCKSSEEYESLVYFFKDAPEESLARQYADMTLTYMKTQTESIFTCIQSCLKKVSEVFTASRETTLREKKDIDSSWDTIRLLLNGVVSQSELKTVLNQFLPEPSVALVEEWSSVFPSANISNEISLPSGRVESVVLDTIGSKPMEPLKGFVQSILDLCRSAVSILQEKLDSGTEESPSFLDSHANQIIHTLLDLSYDTPFLDQALCATILNQLFDTERITEATMVHKLRRSSEFTRSLEVLDSKRLSELTPSLSTVFNSILSVITEYASKLSEDALQEIPLSTIVRFFMTTSDENINNAATEFFTKSLECSDRIIQSIRKATFHLLESTEDVDMKAWIHDQILGVQSSEEIKTPASQPVVTNTIKFITLIISQNNSDIENKIISIGFELFEEAFIEWVENFDAFFLMLKNMCWQNNRVSDLVETVSSFLLQDSVVSLVGNSEAHMKRALLIMQFFHESVMITSPKFTPNSLLASAESAVRPEETNQSSLDSTLCTYTVTEDNFEMQHWYYCYTCNMTFTEGVCSVCAKVCHKDHDISYARYSRFFCDCGAGAVRGLKCKCLTARESGPPPPTTSEPKSADIQLLPEAKENLELYLNNSKFGVHMMGVYKKFISLLQASKPLESSSTQAPFNISINEKEIAFKSDVMSFKRGLKPTFQVKYKFEGKNGRDLKKYVQQKRINRHIVDISSKGLIAIAEQSSISIGTCPKLFDSSKGVLSKSNFKQISSSPINFHTLYMHFNPSHANYIAVAGLKECVVVTVDDRGSTVDQLAIELSLEAMADDLYIIDVIWIPNSQVQLAVVTNQFVKIFDLSKDTICPNHYFSLIEDKVKDVSFRYDKETQQVFMILLAASGMLFVQQLSSQSDGGPCIMIDVVSIDECLVGKGGFSVHYSPELDITIVAYEDGKTFAGKLAPDNSRFLWTFKLNTPEAEDSYHSWIDVPTCPGALVCRNNKDSVVAMAFDKDNLYVQAIPLCSKVEGLTFVPQSLSGNTPMILAIVDDGSLHRMSVHPPHIKIEDDVKEEKTSEAEEDRITIEELRKLTSFNKERLFSIFKKDKGTLLQKLRRSATISRDKKAIDATSSNFPIDYFEKVNNITQDISLGGDVLVCYSSEDAKAQLASNSGYIVVPNSSRFEVRIENPLPDVLIAGVRILIGHVSTKHIPRSLTVLDRTIECKEETRRWYEFPFTPSQCLQAKDQVSLIAKGCSDDSGNSIVIDSLEVYGIPRDKVNWKDELVTTSSSEQASSVLEKTLLICSDTLTSYFRTFPSQISEYQDLVEILPKLLSRKGSKALYSSLQSLLASLNTNEEGYHNIKDAIELSFIAETLASKDNISCEELSGYIQTLNQVVKEREENLFQFLDNFQKFPSTLVKQFWDTHKTNEAAITTEIVSGIILFLFGFMKYLKHSSPQISGLSLLLPAFLLLKEFLTSSDQLIRVYAINAITELYTKDLPVPKVVPPAPEFLAGYSCDRCNKEIFKIRWNCTRCDDFDLCDSCHDITGKVPNTDHDESHPMTRFPPLPVEVEKEAVESPKKQEVKSEKKERENVYEKLQSPSQSRKSDTPPGIDPDDEEALLEMALAMSMQNPVESTDTTEQAFSIDDAFFYWLLDEFKKFTSRGGAEILPIASLLYSLCLHKNSEESLRTKISSLIEATVSNTLDTHVEQRTEQLEVNIIILKLLAALIRDPRGKNPTPSRVFVATTESATITVELLSHTNILLQLFNIAQRAFPLLQDTPSTSERHCGALLKPSSPNISIEGYFPFFSRAQVKKHAGDLFADHQRLLIESTFKLATQLYKRGTNEENKGVTPSDWIPVLCEYINSPRTTFIATKAKSLLLAVCQSKNKYYLVRDMAQYKQTEKEIQELYETSSQFREELSYANTVKLMRCLNVIWQSVSTRPTNWQKFISENPMLMRIFFHASFYFDEGPKGLALKLLAYCFLPETLLSKIINEHGDKEKAQNSEITTGKCTPMPTDAVNELFTSDSISRFLNVFLLEYNNSSIRAEARNLFHWIWFQASESLKRTIFVLLCSKIPMAPAYGRNSAEYFELLSFVIGDRPDADNSSVFRSLLVSLQGQNELLSNHPNSYLYQTLSSLVNFDGYYLESEPCLVCNDPEVPYQQRKFSALKTEYQFTGSSYINKFSESYTIKQITIQLADISKARMIKTINLYYNNKVVQDIATLRDQWKMWKKVHTCDLTPGQRKVVVDFLVPITATNFLVEFADFYEDLQAVEKLQCPRCNQIVTDKHGLCTNCRENAYQCRQCRNINYEDLNAFLCNECGFSKFVSFSISAQVKPSFACDHITNDEERDTAMELVDKESENAYQCYSQIMAHKKPISELILEIQSDTSKSTDQSSLVNGRIFKLASLYGDDCRRAFSSLSKSMQILLGTRRELVTYSKRSVSKPDIIDAQTRPANTCFGCANAFISLCLSLIDNLSQIPSIRKQLVSCTVLQELISTNMLHGTCENRAETRKVICSLVKEDAQATVVLNNLLWKKFEYVLDNHKRIDIAGFIKNEIQLLIEAARIQDSVWETRLQLLMKFFFHASQYDRNSAIVNQILLPCLRYLTEITTTPRVNSTNENGNPSFTVSHPEGHPSITYSLWDEQPTGQFAEWKKDAEVSFIEEHPVEKPKEKENEGEEEQQKDKAQEQEAKSTPTTINYAAVRNILNGWKQVAGVSSLPSLKLTDCWIVNLLFCRNSVSLREEAVKLIKNISSTPTRKRAFLTLLESKLPATLDAGDAASEFFDLFQSLVVSKEAKVYLTLRGFLNTITDLILREIKQIQSLENTFTSDISQGFVLHTFVSLLSSFLEVPGIRRKFKDDELMVTLLDGFLSVRGIIVQKTKLTDDSADQLISLLKSLHGDNEQDNQMFMVACIRALDKHKTGRTPIFIFEQLCNIVCPTKPEPEYLMSLNKSPTQEEFIRGSMTRNPYSSKEAGPLMRDVKNKICTDLDLRGLLEDDNSMELLVNNQIIKLNLSVKQVFEQVWMKALSVTKPEDAPPMDITYRLQGLDGDATEEFVETLPDDSADEVDPEEKYGITSVMATCGGLEAMIDQLEQIKDFDTERELAQQILKLLYHCCYIKENRQKLLHLNSVSVLLGKLKLAFPKESLADIAELLLLIVESIVSEANITESQDIEDLSTSMELNQSEEAKSQMGMFLGKLSSPLVRCNPRIVKSVTRVLPVLTYGEESVAENLGIFFVPFLNFEEFDKCEYEDSDLVFHLECFVNVTTSIRQDANGMKLRDVFDSLGIVDRLYEHITKFMPKEDYSVDNKEPWKAFAELGSLVYILPSLAGLAKGHTAIQQKALDLKILPGLNQLTDMPTTNQIGNFAENLLEALALNNPTVSSAIKDIKSAVEQEKKKKADDAQKEQGVLPAADTSWLEQMEDLDEEVLSCKVCREGYMYYPEQMLGFYVFVKKVVLSSRKDLGYSTVTNFNLIHYSCHNNAADADAQLKPRKEEWEGAMLRNSSTFCNNIFPIRGKDITDESYTAKVDQYWSTVTSACGRCESTRFRLLSHDLRLLLWRYATESSFSEDSRGGGRESNMCMVPFFFQMGNHLLDVSSSAQRRSFEQFLTQFLSTDKNLWLKDSSSNNSDGPIFACVLSLFLQSKEEWNHWKLFYFERVLFQCFFEYKEEWKEKPEVEELFKACKASLVFFQLVDMIQNRFKIASTEELSMEPVVKHSSNANWVQSMTNITYDSGDIIDSVFCNNILKEYENQVLAYDSFESFYKALGLSDRVDDISSHPSQIFTLFKESRS